MAAAISGRSAGFHADSIQARIPAFANGGHKIDKLVDLAPVEGLPATPLLAIDRTEISVPVSPFVPDRNAILLQIADICIAADEPEQFVNDRACVELFRRQQGKTGFEVKSHLVTEHGAGAGAGPVSTVDTFIEYAVQKIRYCCMTGRSGQGCRTTGKVAWRMVAIKSQ